MFGQSTEFVQAAGRLSESGIVAILLFLLFSLGVFVGGVFWFFLKKAFGDQGWIPLAIKEFRTDQRQFMDRIAVAVEEGVSISKDTSAVSRKIDSTVVKLHALMESNRVLDVDAFVKVWKSYISYLRNAAKAGGFHEDVREHIDAMDEIMKL